VRKLPKAQATFVKAAIDAGWRTREAKNGITLYPPSGNRPFTIHGSPKQQGHSHRNMVQALRREGLEV
jgi:hypothetical protein